MRGRVFTVIITLQRERPFSIVYPRVTLPYINECTPGDSIAVPVCYLNTVCVSFRIDDKLYVIEPVNTLEDE